jgi:hypothetical protein
MTATTTTAKTMAKTSNVNKGKSVETSGRQLTLAARSVHSRAAKRASSPSIDTDKSLKNVKPPVEKRPAILAIHQGAGVTKKAKSGRKSVLSSRAKRRQDRGLDRAEAVLDKTEAKVEKSRGRARSVQARAKAWEEQNKRLGDVLRLEEEEEEDVDDDDEGTQAGARRSRDKPASAKETAWAQSEDVDMVHGSALVHPDMTDEVL